MVHGCLVLCSLEIMSVQKEVDDRSKETLFEIIKEVDFTKNRDYFRLLAGLCMPLQ